MLSGTGQSKFLRALLVASTAIVPVCGVVSARAQTTAQVTAFNIPAQPLAAALSAFANQAGLKLAYPASLASGRTAPAVQGSYSSNEALRRLLSGTGLSHQINASGTVTIADRVSSAHAPVAADGSLMLGVIEVLGGNANSAVYAPYATAAATAHIDEATIERYRGSDPTDMFRGMPGVASANARNGSGGIDMNVRGMQGLGRVVTKIDGSSNSVTVPQGYQGYSNRTFVDPDFIGGIDITKGSDAASNGIAGTVSMRTIDAKDIVEEGKRFGFRVKGGFGTNSSKPTPGAFGGYQFPGNAWSPPVATPSPDGMDRPSFLKPTNGHGSAVAAFYDEKYDFLVGYAYRKRGNYHAGKNGPVAKPYKSGPRELCNSWGWCTNWPEYVEVGGIANYRPGEEVLNTELETKSTIAKGTLRFGDGQSLKLGYTGFRSEAGDQISWRMQTNRDRPVQRDQTSGTSVDTYTARYKWQPEENDLIDLTANAWLTDMELRKPWNRGTRTWPTPDQFGLPMDFRTGSDVLMWGLDIGNKSRLDTQFGDVNLDYGLSYNYMTTEPSAYTDELSGPYSAYGNKKELGAFVKANWKPIDWLTVDGGLRYDHYWTQDKRPVGPSHYIENSGKRSAGGLSPSLGLTFEPFEDTQIYGRYSYALRTPSLLETVSGGIAVSTITDIEPERASNWEFGVNHTRQGLFSADDRAMVKLGYFDWTIDNYVARHVGYMPNGYFGSFMYNMDKAKFSGIELSGRYENAGFTAELSANYYTNVEFCPKDTGCANETIYSDFATNQVPPEYMIGLSLSQKLLEDRLTLGGRVTHVGPRAAGHTNIDGQGAGQFISLIKWDPYTLVDVFAEYKFTDNLTATFRVENLTDEFYVDPISLMQRPGPGRTFYASMTAKF
ncbi:hemoglobin/transferrin/lactoferrin receptor protein [Nitratireductor aquibiodomus]|uniref:Hemoglobin/transferrin/lactoferrin receptor protein n=1 Tax=Nitratireductor aquibiodomus TaxID=204799 RepID=A0A1H4IN57_9HYPH|nr:TonB-dependent receptor [Nitratireductor aquibiodomus]SEB35509.1 hemoglobin/transferrin/lactoferrin receptor protein [Nitratireductor aquibiodomus]